MIVICGPGFLFFLITKRKLVKLGFEKQQASSDMIESVVQSLKSIQVVKLYNSKQYLVDRLDSQAQTYAQSMVGYRLLQASPRFVIESIGVGYLVVLLLTTSGTNLVQTAALFGAAAVRLLPSTTRIIANLTSIRHFRSSVSVIADALQLQTSVPTALVSQSGVSQPIYIEKVTYRYEQREVVLHNVSITVQPNQWTTILGESGSGKSTLLYLLCGLLTPDVGEVKIGDEQAAPLIQGGKVRIGYVAQETALLNGSLADNIVFGAALHSDLLWAAIRASNLTEVVEKLPDGVQSNIGEDGKLLSGGQRQRVSLARALYRQPDILVLDEATSGLDLRTETEILNTLSSLKNRMAIVSVTHRISCPEHWDKLIVMEDGQVSFDGSVEDARLVGKLTPHID